MKDPRPNRPSTGPALPPSGEAGEECFVLEATPGDRVAMIVLAIAVGGFGIFMILISEDARTRCVMGAVALGFVLYISKHLASRKRVIFGEREVTLEGFGESSATYLTGTFSHYYFFDDRGRQRLDGGRVLVLEDATPSQSLAIPLPSTGRRKELLRWLRARFAPSLRASAGSGSGRPSPR